MMSIPSLIQRMHILFPGDGVFGALIPLEHRAPALQDLAAGYRLIERIEDGKSGMRIELRRCFLDGWEIHCAICMGVR